MLKGYSTDNGYHGYVDGEYMQFETEDEYLNCIKEWSEEETK